MMAHRLMINTRSTPFIGVRLRENRTPAGRRTSTPARRAALYFAYGRDQEARLAGKQRGDWLGPDDRIHTHEAVMSWARQEALRHRYTCDAVLSVPQGDLTPEEFCQALRQGSEIRDWRLMAHRDTDHHHAHVLFFRDQRLEKETFLSWQTAVRAELARLEQQQADRASQQEMNLEADQSRTRSQGVALES
jgi:hypothetical protein